MTHPVFQLVQDEFERLTRRVRTGFYVASVSALRTYRRAQVVPEWLGEGAVENFRRISSPILDVVPALGTRMAVVSQDGVPELGAMIGQIWDDLGTAEGMTAWLRAHLQKHDGQLELGATKGVRIKVGTNAVDIMPTATGNVVIEVEAGSKVQLGGDLASLEVALAPPLKDYIDGLITELASQVHSDPVSGTTGTPTTALTNPTDDEFHAEKVVAE